MPAGSGSLEGPQVHANLRWSTCFCLTTNPNLGAERFAILIVTTDDTSLLRGEWAHQTNRNHRDENG